MRNYILLFLAAQALTGSSLYAQFTEPFSCYLTADAPAVRSGGAAELLGELRGECTGGSGTITTDLDLSLNANYTGRILNATTSATETLLIVGDPATPTLGTDTFQATLTSPTTLRFSSARFPAPGSAKLTFRIVNTRAAVPATGQTQMLAFLATSGAVAIPFNLPQQTLGFPTQGHNFQITDAAGSPIPALSFATAGTATYRLRFDESTQNAFRRRNTATTLANPTALSPQSAYGQSYQTESGFYLPTLNPSAGLADHGARLMAVISNLPSGVSLAVRAVPNAASSATAQARLTTTAPDGSGPYTAITPAADGTVQLPISGNSARAVWEVLAADPAALENLQFDLLVTTTATSATSAGVTGQLAPLNPKNTADAASPLPRFMAPAVPAASCGANCLIVPSALKVTYTIGGPSPALLSIPVRSTGNALAFTAVASSGDSFNQLIAPPDAPWLSLTPSTGITPATLTATVNPTGFGAGIYVGKITISSGRFTETISVILQVNASPSVAAPPSCSVSSGVPPIVRATGITERLLDIDVMCDPITAGPAITTDLRVSLNTTVTSRPNEILLLVNDPSPSQQSLGSNVFRGEILSSTQLIFRNVVIPADGNMNIFRIVNLNADISRVALSTVNLPTPLQGTVRASAVSIANPAPVLGFVQPSHTFSILDSNNAAVPNLSITPTGKLRFVEGFASAFRRRNAGTTFATPDTLFAQHIPGAIYNTETGFFNPNLPNDGGIDMGLASQGTRLIARFSNIPPGVGIFVSVNESGAVTPKAQLIQTDSNGAGPYQAIVGPTVPVNITNGSGIAVWEILSSTPLSNETLEFTYQLTGTVPSTASVEGLLGSLSTVNSSNVTAPFPRFASANSPTVLCAGGPPCLSVPASISLTSNGTNIPSANVSVTSDADPVTFQVYQLQPAVPWLSLSVPAGVTPGQFTVTANPAGLAPGTYTTQIGINSITTTVNFTVQSAGPAALLLPVERTNRTITVGTTTAPQSVTISGTPGLTWQATANVPWLQLTQPTGTVPATFDVNMNASLLPAGQYEGRITFTAPGVAPVTYAIAAYVTANTSGYTLSGAITGPGATPRPGVTVTLSGSESRTATTAADGTYQFTGLTTGGPYTVTPSTPGYTFTPAAYNFTTIPATQTANFTAATTNGPPSFLSVLPATASGSQATFTVRATDPDGAANLNRVYFLINSSTNIAANTCHGFFDRASRTFFLYNDALTVLSPQPAGAAGSTENSQCRILGPGSTPGADSGTESNFQLQFALKGAYANQSQNVYFWAQDNDGNGTGWLKFVTWTPLGTNPPSLLSANFINDLDAFRVLASDPDNNLSRAYFLIAPTPNITTNGCHGYYDYPTGQFALYDDSLTTLGTENSACAIDVANSSGILSGDVTLAIRRKGNMPATKAFVWLVDATNLGTGWLDTNLSLPLRSNLAPTISNGAPALATGPTQTFTAQITDTNTRFDITRVYFLINPTSAIPANTCHGYYDRATNKTYLYNDSLTALSSTVLENSQCRLQPITQAATTTTGFTLSLNATRKGSYLTTNENVYLWALDSGGNGTGWVPISGWATTVNSIPTVVAPATIPSLNLSTVTFSFTARDTNGAADLDRLYFLLNPTSTISANTCHGFYDISTSTIYLYNDALNALAGPLTPGAAQTIQNTQCAINGAATSVTTTGTDVTLDLNVTVKVPSTLSAYLWPVDKQGIGPGWVRTASWGAQGNQQPTLSAPTPVPNLTGASQSITATVTDLNGASDISRIYFLLNPDTSIPLNSCHGFYDRASNAVYLYNDALTATQGPLTPGTFDSISNTRCQINGSATGIVAGSTTLQFTLGWTRKTAAPAKLYLWAIDNQGRGTGWIQQANHN